MVGNYQKYVFSTLWCFPDVGMPYRPQIVVSLMAFAMHFVLNSLFRFLI